MLEKIIHQIWIGPYPIPIFVMSWVNYCKQYGWDYRLWTDRFPKNENDQYHLCSYVELEDLEDLIMRDQQDHQKTGNVVSLSGSVGITDVEDLDTACPINRQPTSSTMIYDDQGRPMIGLTLQNGREYCSNQIYQGKSDIARYEVLWLFGGFYLDADMVWLGKDLSTVIDLQHSDQVFVPEHPTIRHSNYHNFFVANSFISVSKNNQLMKRLVDGIPDRIKNHKSSFKIAPANVTGPYYLNDMINCEISVIPWHWIFPKSHTDTTQYNPEMFKDKSLVYTYNASEYSHTRTGINRRPIVIIMVVLILGLIIWMIWKTKLR